VCTSLVPQLKDTRIHTMLRVFGPIYIRVRVTVTVTIRGEGFRGLRGFRVGRGFQGYRVVAYSIHYIKSFRFFLLFFRFFFAFFRLINCILS